MDQIVTSCDIFASNGWEHLNPLLVFTASIEPMKHFGPCLVLVEIGEKLVPLAELSSLRFLMQMLR
ncbi:hypothetical protein LOAG_09390 [Loa loa]|nr:hypothetical protein LOAG_09390 [Loa loa]EFO19102.2 hypothetical protein LOAG_09390 [Loa loa]